MEHAKNAISRRHQLIARSGQFRLVKEEEIEFPYTVTDKKLLDEMKLGPTPVEGRIFIVLKFVEQAVGRRWNNDVIVVAPFFPQAVLFIPKGVDTSKGWPFFEGGIPFPYWWRSSLGQELGVGRETEIIVPASIAAKANLTVHPAHR